MANFAHAGMTLEEARQHMKDAEKALRKARKTGGYPESIHRAYARYEYCLMSVAKIGFRDDTRA